MFTNKELIDSLKEEIQYLRSENKDLKDRLMAFASEAFHAYQSKGDINAQMPLPAYVDDSGNIVQVPIAELKTTKDAVDVLNDLMGQ